MTTARVLALSGWMALAAYALPPAGPLRVLVAGVFLTVCPGLAFARLAGSAPTRRYGALVGVLQQGVLAVALSLSLTALTAIAFYLAGVFAGWGVLLTLACLTTALTLRTALRSDSGGGFWPRRHAEASSRGEE